MSSKVNRFSDWFKLIILQFNGSCRCHFIVKYGHHLPTTGSPPTSYETLYQMDDIWNISRFSKTVVVFWVNMCSVWLGEQYDVCGECECLHLRGGRTYELVIEAKWSTTSLVFTTAISVNFSVMEEKCYSAVRRLFDFYEKIVFVTVKSITIILE